MKKKFQNKKINNSLNVMILYAVSQMNKCCLCITHFHVSNYIAC